MFTKCSCQHCNGHIEFDEIHAGATVKCPHCFEETKLLTPQIPTKSAEPLKFGANSGADEPMTEKQKGMFLLYEIPMQEGLSKRDAAILIDRAINTTRPSIEGQRKASAVWGNYRLTKIIEEMTKAIEVLGDEATTVKKLKDTKRKVKEVVQSFTEMIDKRIETIQVENREIRYEKTDEWLKKRGF